jgi:hypothetical protein
MIVEVVAACLTVCFCSSLAFARWAAGREDLGKGTRSFSVSEKRRILEESLAHYRLNDPYSDSGRKRLQELEEKLLKLDE